MHGLLLWTFGVERNTMEATVMPETHRNSTEMMKLSQLFSLNSGHFWMDFQNIKVIGI